MFHALTINIKSDPKKENVICTNLFLLWSLSMKNKVMLFHIFKIMFFVALCGIAGQMFSVQIGIFSTVMTLSFRTDRSGQTVQTQIRLLLEEQSDQGLHCLLFHLHRFNEIP